MQANNIFVRSADRQQLHIGVIGGGSFGTVLAQLMARNRHLVRWWMRDPAQRQIIRETHRNPRYFSHLPLHQQIVVEEHLENLFARSQLVFFVIPARAFPACLKKIREHLHGKHYLISAAKGIVEPEFCLISDLLSNTLRAQGLSPQSTGVLSGPNIAEEIITRHLTGTVIASTLPPLRKAVSQALDNQHFHTFENTDIRGVELGGALKNIYAIAAGIIDQLAFGANSKSLLIIRAGAEMRRFAIRMGAAPLTFLGLSGMGDLIATSISPLSRNYHLGRLLAQGKSMQESSTELSGIAEGVNTLQAVVRQARILKVEMPLAEGLYGVLFEHRRIKHTLWKLLQQIPRYDIDLIGN